MLLKIAQGVFWILAVCLMPGTAYGEGRDVLPGNAAYKVEVFRGGTWEEIFVYNARVSDYAGNPEAGYTQYTMGFALFTDSFRQPLKVHRCTDYTWPHPCTNVHRRSRLDADRRSEE